MAVVTNYTALISGYSWNGMTGAEGAPVFVTYAFLENSEVPSRADYEPYANDGYFAFSSTQRASFRQALAEFETVAGVRFVEVDDPENASISVMNTSGSEWSGWANYGSSSDNHSSNGRLVIDGSGSYAPGTGEFETILHEIGHAMGLKHPFDGDPTLASHLDNDNYTLMSYTGNGVNDQSLAPFDVSALRAIYGLESVISSSWIWSWSDVTGIFSLTAGNGNDRLIAVDAGSQINGMDGNDTLWGRDGDDILNGGDGDDLLYGGAGQNTLNGGSGNDRFVPNGYGSETYNGGSGVDVVDFRTYDYGAYFTLADGNGVENVYGSDFVDYLYGNNLGNDLRGYIGDDYLSGDAGSDILRGGSGNDRLFGGDDNDILMGGAGTDELNGGSGVDTADYSNSNAGVNVSLLTGYTSGGHAAGDTFNSIENLTGSSFGDILNGNNDANVLQGMAGADILRGNGGNDTASYLQSNEAVNISLATGYVAGGHAVGDTFFSIENLTGSAFDDRLSGDGLSQTLTGSLGDDTLVGRGGADRLYGGDGSDTASYADAPDAINISLLSGYASGGHAAGDTFDSIENLIGTRFDDRLVGNNGNNALQGMAGADVLMGNGGEDTASYLLSNEAVNISLASGYVAGGHAAGDTFYSIENLTGSAFDDRLSGDARSQALTGSFGDDTLLGRGGADRLYGGDGSDTASYSDAPDAVNVSLATGYTSGSHATGDTFSSIENLIGTRFDDRLSGNSGRNILEGGAGADYLNGYQELDLVSYAGSSAAVNVSLLTGYVAGGDAVGDTFVSIEGFIGSRFDDTLNGSNGNNVLEGGLGADILRGNGGNDTASYLLSNEAVNISLASGYVAGGHAAGDTFYSIENLTGSAFDDRLSGDGRSQALTGSFGDDTLLGRGGADRLYGGDGSDTASYSDAPDAVNVSLATGYTRGSHAAGDTFSSIENLIGTRFDDRLNGDSGQNMLDGGPGGNDVLVGYGGADRFVFRAGFDHDTISDFQDGTDILDFSGNSQVNSISDVTIGTSGADATVSDGFGNTITILNAAGLIAADDFDFV